ncbi:MAG: phenylalanine--tRNA ligase subunit beta [Candidatus Pacebacteria bacterium]|nr:phenylalanine--tRNA ligase subunit beta [Candidatus Paceibacterota bacterium]
MKVLYSWLNEEYFDNNLPKVEEVTEALLFHSFEIEGVEEVGDDDYVIDIDVLPNRAHDCLSHRGIAKEISVILGIPLVHKKLEVDFESTDSTLSVSVEEPGLCNRFIGRIIRGVGVKESPEWLKYRLEALGQRSISALIDATNYVTLDIGQPTHAFDIKKVPDEKLFVKKSEGEELELLGGDKVTLTKDDLVIASKDGALDIAGVKGGTPAEITKETTDVVLTACHFDPVSVRKTSRRTNILTDASKRFENTPSINLSEEAMEYLTRLICSLCGRGSVERPVDIHGNLPEEKKVIFSTEYVNHLLGTNLSVEEVASIMNKLGFDYQKTGNEFVAVIPDDRLDLDNPSDMAEEIGRIYGYRNIESSELPPLDKVNINKEFYYMSRIRDVLVENGFSEVYTQSFKDKGKVKMANPVAKDRPYLRENIDLSDTLEFNRKNKDLLGLDEIKIFEIGKVFDPEEKLVISIASEKELNSDILKDFDISLNGKNVEIDLGEIVSKLSDDIDGYDFKETPKKMFKLFSDYPFITRDIAVWLPEGIDREELVLILKENSGDLLKGEPRLVDEYKKDNRTSYAHRIVFQSDERTLTDEEVGKIMEEVERVIASRGWEIR